MAEATASTAVEMRVVVQAVLDAIIEAVLYHGSLELRNFGVLEVAHRAASMRRNPKTGAPAPSPAHDTIRFRPGAVVMARLNGRSIAPTQSPRPVVAEAATDVRREEE